MKSFLLADRMMGHMKMKTKFLGKAALLGGAMLWSGAARSAGAEDSTAKTTFVDHVLPVLESSCLNCHNPDESKGGLDLTSYAATMAGGSGGDVVQGGAPDRSRLYTLSAHTEEPHMPPNKPKIEQAQLDVLKRWIEEGMLETKGSKARKVSGPTLSASVETTGARPAEPAMPRHLPLQPEVVTGRGTAVTAIATSPWAPLVAIGGQKQVLLYRTEPLELLGILPFPEGFPEALSFSKNGDLLLAGGGRGGKSGKAVAWDVKTGQRVVEVGREFDTALAADMSPGHRLVALGGPGRNLKIYDTQSGEQLHSIKKHPDWLLEVEFSPDGVLLASAGRNGEIVIWEAQTGIEFYELSDHQKAVTGLSWRADSNVLAACSEDGNVTLWEMQNGKQMKKWAAHPGGALAIHFSPDGSRLVTCGRDKALKIWDLDGKLQREMKGFPDIVTAAAFTQDGKRVISGDWQGELNVWDVATGTQTGKLVSNPPTVEVQLAQARQRARELEAKLLELEKAASAASAASAEAVKKRDAAVQAAVRAQKDQADTAQLVKQGDQTLAETAQKAKATGQERQIAQKQIEETQAAAGRARLQVAAGKSGLAELDKKEAAVPQELAEIEKKVPEAGQRSHQALQARDAAQKAVEKAQTELSQFPGDPVVEAKLAAARQVFEKSEAELRQAEAALTDLAAKRAAHKQFLAGLPQAREDKRREIKVAELVLSQFPSSKEIAERQLAEAEARLGELRKLELATRGPVEEARKVYANLAGQTKQREESAKAAAEAVKQAQSKEDAAKSAVARGREELAFARYEVDKWQAALVNLELRAENESLENCREQYIRYEAKAKTAVEEHEAAAQALAQAEQALRKAREVMQKNSAIVENATDQVVETGLKVLAAQLADDMVTSKAGSSPGPKPSKAEPSRAEALAAQKPDFQKELEMTASQVKDKLAELVQASHAAEETPAVIEERSRQRSAREAEMKKALDAVRMQEKEVEEKTKAVEQLRKRYEELYREWGQDKAAASPAK